MEIALTTRNGNRFAIVTPAARVWNLTRNGEVIATFDNRGAAIAAIRTA